MQSKLTISPDDNPHEMDILTDFDSIAAALSEIGIGYERWQAEAPLSETASPEEVAKAYESSIARIMQRGYKTFDVVSMHPAAPNAYEARSRFIREHTHAEDEVRFFVDGSGLFYIHKAGKVFMMLCTQGDFINLPAGTPHWFDMGPKPFFKAIRVFNNPEGWVARFTGNAISESFPQYE